MNKKPVLDKGEYTSVALTAKKMFYRDSRLMGWPGVMRWLQLHRVAMETSFCRLSL
ncbi:MAG: hypothetical protein V2B20_07120 [Pseudomonadota bacterium]